MKKREDKKLKGNNLSEKNKAKPSFEFNLSFLKYYLNVIFGKKKKNP